MDPSVDPRRERKSGDGYVTTRREEWIHYRYLLGAPPIDRPANAVSKDKPVNRWGELQGDIDSGGRGGHLVSYTFLSLCTDGSFKTQHKERKGRHEGDRVHDNKCKEKVILACRRVHVMSQTVSLDELFPLLHCWFGDVFKVLQDTSPVQQWRERARGHSC